MGTARHRRPHRVDGRLFWRRRHHRVRPPAPGYPDPPLSTFGYFASLSNVPIYNASYLSPLASGTTRPNFGPYVIDPGWVTAALSALSAGKILVTNAGNDAQ